MQNGRAEFAEIWLFPHEAMAFSVVALDAMPDDMKKKAYERLVSVELKVPKKKK